ncbi:MAG: hypothetical protein CM15mP85_18090 [Rhodobacterales bacterium]|nr:MAG: hypothetical protein CM15mP85_18090 [Rhodobacterales bacterium]
MGLARIQTQSAVCPMKKVLKPRLQNMQLKFSRKTCCKGSYVLNWGACRPFLTNAMLAPMLIGCEAEERTGIFENLKREARQFDWLWGTVL